MSALDIAPLELPRTNTGQLTGAASIEIPPTVQRAIRAELARYFWRFYLARRDDVLFRKTVLGVVKVTVKWRDARPLFVALFGDPPIELGSGSQ